MSCQMPQTFVLFIVVFQSYLIPQFVSNWFGNNQLPKRQLLQCRPFSLYFVLSKLSGVNIMIKSSMPAFLLYLRISGETDSKTKYFKVIRTQNKNLASKVNVEHFFWTKNNNFIVGKTKSIMTLIIDCVFIKGRITNLSTLTILLSE